MKRFLDECLAIGKIDQVRYDKAIAKLAKKAETKQKYKTDKAKLTKTDLQTILDTLCE